MGDSSFKSGFKTGFGSAFLQFALERVASLGSFAWKEIGLIMGFEDELRKLERTYLKIQDLVDHMETSPLRFSGGSRAWQIWFEDLQKLAYDADALLDRVSFDLSMYRRQHSINGDQETHQALPMILKSLKLYVPHEVNGMQRKLEALAEEVKSLLDIETVKKGIWTCKKIDRHCSDTSSMMVDKLAVVGRREDRDNVLRLLGDDGIALSVIALVGMGGVGKTALAQLVFDHLEAAADFELIVWVSVSVDFDVRRITKLIIESATKQSFHVFELDSLQRKLLQILLSSGKLLLVLDDYWNENVDDWEVLSAPFRYAAKGSKVIVTTRSSIVSRIVGSTEAYNVKPLSDDDCWSLMKLRASFKIEANGLLESLGKEIAKKCKGLPLAAKVLGSLLQCKYTDNELLRIANSDMWDSSQDENGVLTSLMLSYQHLPMHLKKCFTYCSIFPQNHEFEVEDLVLLWMAEGFIRPQAERRLEDIGHDYFNDLYMRSFFQRGTSSSNRIIYTMHGLIHDLARLVSTNVCFQVEHNAEFYPLFGNACHLSLHHRAAQALTLSASIRNERLRTFMVVCKRGSPRGLIDPELFHSLKFLRVLYLCDIGLNKLPDTVDQLVYLRYLNLCGNRIEYLPRSLCELAALQTLLICNCPTLLELPKDLKNLSDLRHLMFNVVGRLRFMPPEFGKLTNLQTLSAFIVRRMKGHGIEELENMNSLRGTLCVKNIDKVQEVTDAGNAKMNMKEHLNKLELLWGPVEDGIDPQDKDRKLEQQLHVLNQLEPHRNLKELEIKYYSGVKCPDWLSDPWRKFTRIHLQGLGYCKSLPSLGRLPFLKSLCIKDMNALEHIGQSFYGDGNEKFPSLISLEVYRMSELIHWMVPNGIICMLRLTTLRIEDCPKLTSLPARFQSVPDSNILGCPLL
ncbi:putative disease resistance RPP13-like protein 1 [Andrographis paniculata]|uniref:putative disease resistance RPP13-like protein 1 n=1 Tax=Andrographis paniculata TaxID=175694 RepID=UPI0021E81F84|nr:putative disease resistance RPP13-like protein 1 [Andrographis paniculata]